MFRQRQVRTPWAAYCKVCLDWNDMRKLEQGQEHQAESTENCKSCCGTGFAAVPAFDIEVVR